MKQFEEEKKFELNPINILDEKEIIKSIIELKYLLDKYVLLVELQQMKRQLKTPFEFEEFQKAINKALGDD